VVGYQGMEQERRIPADSLHAFHRDLFAKAGLNDLYHETLKIYPAAIAISAEGREIANGNCLRCHFSTVQNTPMGAGGADCLKCHRFTVHQRGLEKGGGIILGQQ